MKVYLKSGFTYIPEWQGNREEKPEDQIKIHFKFLSANDLTETLADGKADVAKEWLFICDKIENLTVDIDGAEIVVTPDGLYNIKSLYELYIECRLAFKAESNVSKKKLL